MRSVWWVLEKGYSGKKGPCKEGKAKIALKLPNLVMRAKDKGPSLTKPGKPTDSNIRSFFF